MFITKEHVKKKERKTQIQLYQNKRCFYAGCGILCHEHNFRMAFGIKLLKIKKSNVFYLTLWIPNMEKKKNTIISK